FLAPEENIDVALVATPPTGTFERLKRLKLVQSLWMGVERLLADPAFPRGVPLARLVDPGMGAALEPAQAVPRLGPHRRAPRAGRARQRRRPQAGRARLQPRRLEPPAEEARRSDLPYRPRRRAGEKRRRRLPPAADEPHARHPECTHAAQDQARRRG